MTGKRYEEMSVYADITNDEIVFDLTQEETNMVKSLGRPLTTDETKDLWRSYLYMRKENKMN